MNDPATFAKAWQWTKTNMRRPHDRLLAWQWDEKQGIVGIDSATDADQDIAYALLLAGQKWNNPAYTADGLAIINDLWRISVKKIRGHYYLSPGTWSGFHGDYLSLDPSYFAPYVYRKFAEYDKPHAEGWNALADDIYDTLEDCTTLTKPGLPPNWCGVKYLDDGGPLIVFSDRQGEGASDFSYDAFRVYWRMSMDAALSPSPGKERARNYLHSHPFLLQYWRQHRLMPEGFTAEGAPRGQETSGFAMGPALVLSHFENPVNDAALYQAMLAPQYNSQGYWFNDYNDYLHSVIWLHLYSLSLH
jgi:endo-1,4-beta-D-glucanase Y